MIKTKDLVYMAMYIALFTVLEYAAYTLPILAMPNGGKLSFAIIPLIISSYHLGFVKSLIVVFGSLFFKFLMKAPHYLSLPQFILDYIVPYAAYSLAGLIRSVKFTHVELPMGVLVSNLIRFMSHTAAGVFFWSDSLAHRSLWIGSALVNGSLMFPITVMSFVVVMLIKPRLLKNLAS